MGKKSREKREVRLVRNAVNEFAPQIQAVGYQQGYHAGLQEAAACKTIAEVRRMAKESHEPSMEGTKT